MQERNTKFPCIPSKCQENSPGKVHIIVENSIEKVYLTIENSVEKVYYYTENSIEKVRQSARMPKFHTDLQHSTADANTRGLLCSNERL